MRDAIIWLESLPGTHFTLQQLSLDINYEHTGAEDRSAQRQALETTQRPKL